MTEQRPLLYQPVLDGVRAVAVALVLVFHGGASWMTGGYVGVSVFFTLSGYLITSLLLVEHDTTGRIAPGAFYARRVKRLLPASLLCLSGVSVAAAFGAFDEFPHLRRDLFGALFQVANWVKLSGGDSYADLTNASLGRVAPLEHYWSLAIEEQFYWVWPLVMIALLGFIRVPRHRAMALVMLAALVGVAAPVVAHVWGANAAYWATPARAGEILVGAALAGLLHVHRRIPQWARWVAPAGLAVVGWAAVSWPAATGPAYQGWLPVFALATAALLWGLQVPGPVRTVLSHRVLVAVGGISYGLYLYHWPIFAVLDEERVGVHGGWLFAVRIGVTTLAAIASAVLIEQPVRRWSPVWQRPLVAAVAVTALIAGSIGLVVRPAAAHEVNGRQAAGASAAIQPVDGTLAPLHIATTVVPVATTTSLTTTAVSPTTSPTSPTSPTSTVVSTVPGSSVPWPVDLAAVVPIAQVTRPVRILVVGDSTALITGQGLAVWAAGHPQTAQVSVSSVAGCGFLRDGRVPTDGAIDWTSPCRQLLDHDVPAAIASLHPDVVMLMVTMRDVEDRVFDGIDGPISPFDARFRQRLFDAYASFAQTLIDQGVGHVAWVLAPYPAAPFQGEQRKMLDHARYDVQFDVIGEVASRHPHVIGVVDMASWLADAHLDLSGEVRPDGLHWSDPAAGWVGETFLVGSLVGIALE